MSLDSETRQRLLELVYDLLPEAAAAELHRRMEAEPELARAYAEARDTAQLFSEAARLPVEKIKLQRPEGTMSSSSDFGNSVKPQAAQAAVKVRSPWSRGVNWVVGLSTVVLLMVSLGGYFFDRVQRTRIADRQMRLQVTGPAGLQSGVAAEYHVVTTAVDGRAMPAQIEFALYSPANEQLFGLKEESDEQGFLPVVIPADLVVPSGSRLEVLAVHDNKLERVETRVEVQPVRYATQLSLDKPLYRPGETIYYRSLTLSRFGLAADRQFPVHFEILDPSGAVVPGSQHEGATEHGVGNGSFQIPPEQSGGRYELVARSLHETFAEQRRPLFIRRYRLPQLKKELEFARDSYAPGDTVVADFQADRAAAGPAAGATLRIVATLDGEPLHEQTVQADQAGAFQVKFDLPEKIERGDGQLTVIVDDGGNRETIAKTIPINLGKVEVSFYPEGGELVHGLKNRVYFVGRDPLGEPVHVRGTIVDGNGNDQVGVETTHEGMGSFSFTPLAGEQYSLKITSPPGIEQQTQLPPTSTEQKIVFSTGAGVFDADEPLRATILASEPGLPLVVAASCRGVPVGQQKLVTELSGNGGDEVVIPLAGEIGGVIRLTVYDYSHDSTSTPQPVAERLVYRRMGRKLKVRAADHLEKHSPGERVNMALIVTNEQDQPVPGAVLGVAVVDDTLLNLADDDTASMPTHFLLSGEVEKPEDLEEADFYLSDGAEAAGALDLLLGTQGWRRFVKKTLEELQDQDAGAEQLTRLAALAGPEHPPAMFDNLEHIRAEYDAGLAAYQQRWTGVLNTLTTVSFFGGLGLLLFVAMLGLLKIGSGVHLWVPAVGAAACCLFVGVFLMNPGRLASDSNLAVAFLPFNAAPPEVTETSGPSLLVRDGIRFGDDEARRDEEEGDEFGRLEMLVDGEEGLADDLAPMDKAGKDDDGLEKLREREMRERGGEMREHFKKLANLAFSPDGKLLLHEKDLRQLAKLNKEMVFLKDYHVLDGSRGNLTDEDIAKRLEEFRFTVREYAHAHVAGQPGVRADFAETVFWHPLLVTDENGRVAISPSDDSQRGFDLSDSVTTFRVLVDAHGAGRIGAGRAEIVSRIPFSLEPKLPLEVNAGDRIDLPLAVINDSDQQLPVELLLEHGELVTLDGQAARKLELGPGQRGREYFTLSVSGEKGDCELTFRGTAGQLGDAINKPLRVVPPGFPKSVSHSGQIDGPQELVVELPEHWVAGSLEVALNVFPSTLAELQKGMDSILREPCGCFEQASTSNYPNVLSLQYMQEHDVASPAVTRRAKELLKKGYGKLTAYECKKKGYEWFGGDPGHEALTAYGLMEFRDMARVYDVDPEMIARTAEWLLDRRDGKGGFKRNAKALDSFGRAPDEVTNAYITWALSESGQDGIEKEVEQVVQLASASDDAYLIALAAASAIDAEKKDEGKKLLEKLAGIQDDDGHLEGKLGSITRSGGRSLQVETTALAAMAWLKMPGFAVQANRAVEWIVNSRGGSGGFGSTQATILALKALVEHSKANRKTPAAGTLIIKRDDLQIGEHSFGAGQQETIVVDGLEADLKPGDNKLTITLSGDNKLPYALDVAYRTRVPQSDENCPLRLVTKLAGEKVRSGETVAMTAELTNTSGEGQPMTIAILGLPAGLEVRPEQLEELKKSGTIDYYETRAREVICYWRSLAAKKKIDVKLDLVAAIPGKYIGPASRTYLYYTSEQKQWADPLEVEISRE